MTGGKTVLVTGAGGYIGRLAVAQLAGAIDGAGEPRLQVIASDIRLPEPADRLDGVIYEQGDVREQALAELMTRHGVSTVVHLAAMVSPGKKSNRELEYSVDVEGTRNVLRCCLEAGVAQFVVTSSGAAYGYYPDNPAWIDEEDELRGNREFAYSDHKRLVEEMLARWRTRHPQLGQLIFRPGTVLGATTRNQITDLFDGKVVVGVAGSEIPFVLIWDHDVVGAIVKGVLEGATGIYNMAGDGALPMREMAKMAGKEFLPLPVKTTRAALAVLKKLGRTQYGPEQLDFLRYRPVLSNRRLKEEFGYIPHKTTRQVWEFFLRERARDR